MLSMRAHSRTFMFSLLATTRGVAGLAVAAAPPGNVLVLGGTGFVGSTVVTKAIDAGWKVTSLSRRGVSDNLNLPGVEWLSGDATDPAVVEGIIRKGKFDAVVHAIGMLFASDLNKFVSGSGSVPAPGATYDQITRQTALSTAKAFAASARRPKTGGAPPMVFVSAAEARWTFDASFEGTPAAWLHEYLIAKRAVEDTLLNDYGAGKSPKLRPVILRPSLVWTYSKPLALPAVAAFAVANALKVPFVDRPTNVETLAAAAVAALSDTSARGVYDFRGMAKLADAL